MKRLFAFMLVFIFVFSLASCLRRGDTEQETTTNITTAVPVNSNEIKIGVLEPLTGEDSIGGNQELLGIKFANRLTPKVKLGEKEYKIKLKVIDDESSYKTARDSAEKLISSGVSAVIGSHGSVQTAAVAEALSQAGIPVVAVTASSVTDAVADGKIFRICCQVSYQAQFLASYAYDTLGLRKACAVSLVGNDDDQTLAYFFAQEFAALGGDTVNVAVEQGKEDFASVFESAKEQECDLLLAALSASYAEDFVAAAYENGSDIPIISGAKWDTAAVLEAAWNYDATLYTASFAKESTENDFYYRLQEWITNDGEAMRLNGGGFKISSASVMGYDAYNVITKAISSADSAAPGDIFKALKATSHDGVSGKIEFNSSGLIKSKSLYIKKADVVNNVWKYAD